MNVRVVNDSFFQCPKLVRALTFYFDSTEMLLPMLAENEPYYSEQLWREIYPAVRPLMHADLFSYDEFSVFNELTHAPGVVKLACDSLGSIEKLAPYSELMKLPHIERYLDDCCREDSPIMKYFKEGTTNVVIQNSFRLAQQLIAVYERKHIAGLTEELPRLYNEISEDLGLMESSEALTSEEIYLPFYDIPFAGGERSILAVRQQYQRERKGLQQALQFLSGFYPLEKDRLKIYLDKTVNPGIRRFNKAATEGKLPYLERLKQQLGEPSEMAGVTVTFFSDSWTHMKTAAAQDWFDKSCRPHYLNSVGPEHSMYFSFRFSPNIERENLSLPASGKKHAPMEERELERIQILSGDVSVTYENDGEFEIPSKTNREYELKFDRVYTIREKDPDKDFSCDYRVEDRLFTNDSFIEGNTLKNFPKDGFELRQHPDGWQFLYIYRKIPTFDEFDKKWDGHLHIAVYRDGNHINLLSCKHGFRTAGVKIFLNMHYPEIFLEKYLEYLQDD